MAAEQRKLLGTSRGPQLSITEPKVCKSYLVGTCPHDLFTNTKNDLGACPKVHNENLKTEYEAANEEQKQKWGFDFDYLRDMNRYLEDCNRKIDAAQRRLEKTAEEIQATNTLLRQISELTKSIVAGIVEIQVLAELGAVSQAVQDHYKLRQLQQGRIDRERDLKTIGETAGPSGHQKLQVCDVCGAYLSRLDNDRRLADHFYGKMHLGYAQMRRTADALAKSLKGKQPPVRDEPVRTDDGWRDTGAGGAGANFGGGGGGRRERGFGHGGGRRGPRGGYGRW